MDGNHPLPEYASPPLFDGTEVTVRNFTATTTPQVHAVPATWRGRYIRVTAFDATVYWYFTTSASAVPAVVVASAAGAATTDQGATYPPGYGEDDVLQIPQAADSDTIYLARIASNDSGRLELRLR